MANQTASRGLESRQWNDSWACMYGSGGPGHDGLKKIHAGFNRVFGDAKLRIAMDQCYTAKCHGLYFAVCNESGGATVTEVVNARNYIRNKNPENDHGCQWAPFENKWQRYYFGYGDLKVDARRWKQDIRRC